MNFCVCGSGKNTRAENNKQIERDSVWCFMHIHFEIIQLVDKK